MGMTNAKDQALLDAELLLADAVRRIEKEHADYVALEARLRAVEADRDSADESADAQFKKFEECPHHHGDAGLCGCSFDLTGDICAYHAPQLKDALRKLKEAERERDVAIKQSDKWMIDFGMAQKELAAITHERDVALRALKNTLLMMGAVWPEEFMQSHALPEAARQLAAEHKEQG